MIKGSRRTVNVEGLEGVGNGVSPGPAPWTRNVQVVGEITLKIVASFTFLFVGVPADVIVGVIPGVDTFCDVGACGGYGSGEDGGEEEKGLKEKDELHVGRGMLLLCILVYFGVRGLMAS